MDRDVRVEDIVRQWSSEQVAADEFAEARSIASAWLAEAEQGRSARLAEPGVLGAGIPEQRGPESGAGAAPGMFAPSTGDPGYVAAMQRRLPGVPTEALHAAASCWALVGSVRDAQEWWDAGVSPLDQRALDYRAAGLTPEDLARHLGPYTVLEHLRKGSAPAWCVARLRRRRRDATA